MVKHPDLSQYIYSLDQGIVEISTAPQPPVAFLAAINNLGATWNPGTQMWELPLDHLAAADAACKQYLGPETRADMERQMDAILARRRQRLIGR